jgi:hypothetical protein
MISSAAAQHGHFGGLHNAHTFAHHRSAHHDTANEKKNISSQDNNQLPGMPQLSTRLKQLLPKGTNLQEALEGFKNLGQFVAAAHLSHNTGIPFSQLKAKIVGPPRMSVGRALQQLRPQSEADDRNQTATAQRQAEADLDAASSRSAATTTTVQARG